jgi:hypothetical protein
LRWFLGAGGGPPLPTNQAETCFIEALERWAISTLVHKVWDRFDAADEIFRGKFSRVGFSGFGFRPLNPR